MSQTFIDRHHISNMLLLTVPYFSSSVPVDTPIHGYYDFPEHSPPTVAMPSYNHQSICALQHPATHNSSRDGRPAKVLGSSVVMTLSPRSLVHNVETVPKQNSRTNSRRSAFYRNSHSGHQSRYWGQTYLDGGKGLMELIAALRGIIVKRKFSKTPSRWNA